MLLLQIAAGEKKSAEADGPAPTEEQASAVAELVDTRAGGGGGVGGGKKVKLKPKSKKGSSLDEQAASEVQGPTYEEMVDVELRAQLEKLADQVRASAGVKSKWDRRKDWTETESDKELRKTLEVAIEKKVSLEELNFSHANLSKMK